MKPGDVCWKGGRLQPSTRRLSGAGGDAQLGGTKDNISDMSSANTFHMALTNQAEMWP